MTDGDALRGAIIAQPDDDTLRLVFADWLDENGQPDRAAFVRAQVWGAQADPFGPVARRHDATAKRLLDWSRRAAWAKGVHPWVMALEFRRGFVEHVAVNVATFPRDAAALFAAEPVRSVKLVRTVTAHSLDPFFDAPQLARVTRLDLADLPIAPNEFDALPACPHLAAVTDLCLRRIPVPPAWLTALLVGPALPALTGLDLSDVSNLGPCLVDALPRADRHFARLDLSHVAFSSPGLQQALASRCLREVEELRLGWMPRSPRMGALTHLDLSWGIIPWTRLRLLDLNGQGVGDDGITQIITELSRRREPAPLRWLGLANNRIGPTGVRELVRSDASKLKLYHLDMSGNALTLSQRAALQTRFPEAVIVDDLVAETV